MTGNFLCCKQPLYQLCHNNCPTPSSLGQLPHLILDAHWPVPASRVDPHDLEKLVAKTSPIAEHCLKTISRLATSRFFHGHFWPLPSWFYSFLQRTVNKFTFELNHVGAFFNFLKYLLRQVVQNDCNVIILSLIFFERNFPFHFDEKYFCQRGPSYKWRLMYFRPVSWDALEVYAMKRVVKL